MIGLPFNDLRCLGSITEVITELVDNRDEVLAEIAAKHGDEQVHIWRRSYDVAPAPLGEEDPRNPRFDPRYRDVPEAELPRTAAADPDLVPLSTEEKVVALLRG